MSTVNPVVTLRGDHSVEFYYAAMGTTPDTGAPIPERWADYADRSVQVSGTFGVGGNLRVQGSNDGGSTYAALSDPQGNALNIAAAKIESITEATLLTQPKVTAGDGTTNLNVTIVCRRARSAKEI